MNYGDDVDGSDTTEKSDYTAEKILDAIREDPFITIKGLATKLGGFNLIYHFNLLLLLLPSHTINRVTLESIF